eukprot:TRINITY_DN9733_c0_g1_i2.p1 TRINITY_DN9733_c0_g1~~TRINITY_DN9733_c0_g1_i2.p1  ORF type:complete len:2899 (+),score=660.13 TRINITY_DN9733_c0_g1_i2:123-8819(+)
MSDGARSGRMPSVPETGDMSGDEADSNSATSSSSSSASDYATESADFGREDSSASSASALGPERADIGQAAAPMEEDEEEDPIVRWMPSLKSCFKPGSSDFIAPGYLDELLAPGLMNMSVASTQVSPGDITPDFERSSMTDSGWLGSDHQASKVHLTSKEGEPEALSPSPSSPSQPAVQLERKMDSTGFLQRLFAQDVIEMLSDSLDTPVVKTRRRRFAGRGYRNQRDEEPPEEVISALLNQATTPSSPSSPKGAGGGKVTGSPRSDASPGSWRRQKAQTQGTSLRARRRMSLDDPSLEVAIKEKKKDDKQAGQLDDIVSCWAKLGLQTRSLLKFLEQAREEDNGLQHVTLKQLLDRCMKKLNLGKVGQQLKAADAGAARWGNNLSHSLTMMEVEHEELMGANSIAFDSGGAESSGKGMSAVLQRGRLLQKVSKVLKNTLVGTKTILESGDLSPSSNKKSRKSRKALRAKDARGSQLAAIARDQWRENTEQVKGAALEKARQAFTLFSKLKMQFEDLETNRLAIRAQTRVVRERLGGIISNISHRGIGIVILRQARKDCDNLRAQLLAYRITLTRQSRADFHQKVKAELRDLKMGKEHARSQYRVCQEKWVKSVGYKAVQHKERVAFTRSLHFKWVALRRHMQSYSEYLHQEIHAHLSNAPCLDVMKDHLAQFDNVFGGITEGTVEALHSSARLVNDEYDKFELLVKKFPSTADAWKELSKAIDSYSDKFLVLETLLMTLQGEDGPATWYSDIGPHLIVGGSDRRRRSSYKMVEAAAKSAERNTVADPFMDTTASAKHFCEGCDEAMEAWTPVVEQFGEHTKKLEEIGKQWLDLHREIMSIDGSVRYWRTKLYTQARGEEEYVMKTQADDVKEQIEALNQRALLRDEAEARFETGVLASLRQHVQKKEMERTKLSRDAEDARAMVEESKTDLLDLECIRNIFMLMQPKLAKAQGQDKEAARRAWLIAPRLSEVVVPDEVVQRATTMTGEDAAAAAGPEAAHAARSSSPGSGDMLTFLNGKIGMPNMLGSRQGSRKSLETARSARADSYGDEGTSSASSYAVGERVPSFLGEMRPSLLGVELSDQNTRSRRPSLGTMHAEHLFAASHIQIGAAGSGYESTEPLEIGAALATALDESASGTHSRARSHSSVDYEAEAINALVPWKREVSSSEMSSASAGHPSADVHKTDAEVVDLPTNQKELEDQADHLQHDLLAGLLELKSLLATFKAGPARHSVTAVPLESSDDEHSDVTDPDCEVRAQRELLRRGHSLLKGSGDNRQSKLNLDESLGVIKSVGRVSRAGSHLVKTEAAKAKGGAQSGDMLDGDNEHDMGATDSDLGGLMIGSSASGPTSRSMGRGQLYLRADSSGHGRGGERLADLQGGIFAEQGKGRFMDGADGPKVRSASKGKSSRRFQRKEGREATMSPDMELHIQAEGLLPDSGSGRRRQRSASISSQRGSRRGTPESGVSFEGRQSFVRRQSTMTPDDAERERDSYTARQSRRLLRGASMRHNTTGPERDEELDRLLNAHCQDSDSEYYSSEEYYKDAGELLEIVAARKAMETEAERLARRRRERNHADRQARLAHLQARQNLVAQAIQRREEREQALKKLMASLDKSPDERFKELEKLLTVVPSWEEVPDVKPSLNSSAVVRATLTKIERRQGYITQFQGTEIRKTKTEPNVITDMIRKLTSKARDREQPPSDDDATAKRDAEARDDGDGIDSSDEAPPERTGTKSSSTSRVLLLDDSTEVDASLPNLDRTAMLDDHWETLRTPRGSALTNTLTNIEWLAKKNIPVEHALDSPMSSVSSVCSRIGRRASRQRASRRDLRKGLTERAKAEMEKVFKMLKEDIGVDGLPIDLRRRPRCRRFMQGQSVGKQVSEPHQWTLGELAAKFGSGLMFGKSASAPGLAFEDGSAAMDASVVTPEPGKAKKARFADEGDEGVPLAEWHFPVYASESSGVDLPVRCIAAAQGFFSLMQHLKKLDVRYGVQRSERRRLTETSRERSLAIMAAIYAKAGMRKIRGMPRIGAAQSKPKAAPSSARGGKAPLAQADAKPKAQRGSSASPALAAITQPGSSAPTEDAADKTPVEDADECLESVIALVGNDGTENEKEGEETAEAVAPDAQREAIPGPDNETEADAATVAEDDMALPEPQSADTDADRGAGDAEDPDVGVAEATNGDEDNAATAAESAAEAGEGVATETTVEAATAPAATVEAAEGVRREAPAEACGPEGKPEEETEEGPRSVRDLAGFLEPIVEAGHSGFDFQDRRREPLRQGSLDGPFLRAETTPDGSTVQLRRVYSQDSDGRGDNLPTPAEQEAHTAPQEEDVERSLVPEDDEPAKGIAPTSALQQDDGTAKPLTPAPTALPEKPTKPAASLRAAEQDEVAKPLADLVVGVRSSSGSKSGPTGISRLPPNLQRQRTGSKEVSSSPPLQKKLSASPLPPAKGGGMGGIQLPQNRVQLPGLGVPVEDAQEAASKDLQVGEASDGRPAAGQHNGGMQNPEWVRMCSTWSDPQSASPQMRKANRMTFAREKLGDELLEDYLLAEGAGAVERQTSEDLPLAAFFTPEPNLSGWSLSSTPLTTFRHCRSAASTAASSSTSPQRLLPRHQKRPSTTCQSPPLRLGRIDVDRTESESPLPERPQSQQQVVRSGVDGRSPLPPRSRTAAANYAEPGKRTSVATSGSQSAHGKYRPAGFANSSTNDESLIQKVKQDVTRVATLLMRKRQLAEGAEAEAGSPGGSANLDAVQERAGRPLPSPSSILPQLAAALDQGDASESPSSRQSPRKETSQHLPPRPETCDVVQLHGDWKAEKEKYRNDPARSSVGKTRDDESTKLEDLQPNRRREDLKKVKGFCENYAKDYNWSELKGWLGDFKKDESVQPKPKKAVKKTNNTLAAILTKK